ncbi:MAG: DNA double-strand break repair nuclease NurA, partial [Candidatus Diapherotrites archaeon]
DSGFVGKNLFALDLILIRAISAIFTYNENKLSKAEYLPNFFSFPEPHLSNNSLENHEFETSKSLKRLIEEVTLSKRTILEKNPDYLFIDGSIIPQHQDKPRKDSKIKSQYHELLETFQDFYDTAEKNQCELIACVEDSRGSRFRTMLQEEILPEEISQLPELDNCFDSVLLDYLLRKGERCSAFTYTKSIKDHPILMDYEKKWAEKVHAFYLKPAEFDRPLRVEFLSNGNIPKQASKIAEVAYAQSSMHREYAYPAVLIEADMHARLKPDEISIVYDKILDKLSKGFKIKLRRDNRPFK